MNTKELVVEIHRVPIDCSWFPDVDEKDEESHEAIISIDHNDETITYCFVKKGKLPGSNVDDEAFPFDDFDETIKEIKERSLQKWEQK